MSEIREIGIEKEMFLIDSNNTIMEPKLYGFPRDEFEFLVELRSIPSDRLYPIYTTIQQEELQYKLRANKFGMELVDFSNYHISPEWVDNHWKKYNLHRFNDCDYTKNIYNKNVQSHHLGVIDEDFDGFKSKRLTAGMHVHFSSRDADTGEVIDLPIEEIVKSMDKYFHWTIKEADRNLGEYELKTHGFEYRSLPCNVGVYEVLKKGFEILRNV